MKFLFVFASVMAVAYTAQFDNLVKQIQMYSKKDGDISLGELENLVKGAFIDVCSQIEIALCGSNGTKIYDGLISTADCFLHAKSDGIICDTMNDEFKKCIAPIEKVIEGCVDPKFHDIPKLIVDSITSTNNYFCNSKVRDILELSHSCVADDVENTMTCVAGIENKIKNINDVKNLKTEICSELTKQKSCILTQVNKNCKNELTKKSYSDLYDAAIVKPCAA